MGGISLPDAVTDYVLKRWRNMKSVSLKKMFTVALLALYALADAHSRPSRRLAGWRFLLPLKPTFPQPKSRPRTPWRPLSVGALFWH